MIKLQEVDERNAHEKLGSESHGPVQFWHSMSLFVVEVIGKGKMHEKPEEQEKSLFGNVPWVNISPQPINC